MSENELLPQGDSVTELIDRLFDEVDGADDLPAHVVRATELMLFGVPIRRVAKEVGVSVSQVRKWLKDYPQMGAIIARGKEAADELRRQQLELLFQKAIEFSEYLLDLDARDTEDLNVKLLGIQAQHARHFLSIFAPKKDEVSVLDRQGTGKPLLIADESALDYIAQAVAGAINSDIPVRYEVVDGEFVETYLDENGQPPHGEIGVLLMDEKGRKMCHVCGNYYKNLEAHIHTHRLNADTYGKIYGVYP